MRQALIIVLLLLTTLNGWAQSRGAYKRANTLYQKFAYADAIQAYEKIYRKSPSDSVRIKIARSHDKLNQPGQVAAWYLKVHDTDQLIDEDFVRFADALESVGDYQQALGWYEKYQAAHPGDSRTSLKIQAIERLRSYYQDSALYDIQHLNINGESYDFAPAFFDEKLLFSSTRDTGTLTTRIHSWNNQPFLDLYVGDITDQGQINGVSKLDGSINTEFHESTASLSPDGNTLYFTRNNYTNETYRTDKKNTNKLKLYKANRTGNGSFGNVQELPFNSDSFSTAHPAVSPDGKILYFSSDRDGSNGESDIWMVEITENGYGPVENLGTAINTPGRDTFPFVDADGKLYFSTDGRGGLGGLDVYVYDSEKNSITNLGEPINSPKDDFTFIYNTESGKGYFASNRSNDPLDDDIYTFTRAACESTLIVQVIDKNTREPLNGALVGIRNIDNDLVISGVAEVPDAKFSYQNPDCGADYFARAEMEGYATAEKNVTIPEKSSEVLVVIELEPSIVDIPPDFDLGKLINPIYFDFDKSFIRPDAAVELAKIIEIMKEYPQLHIDVRSHTDSRGNDAYNMALSERRNKSTIDYIVEKGGIERDRLTGRGYGESQLLNECSNGVPCTEEQHQLNRRSEFIVQDY